MARVYNFSAGPAVLPEEVLRQAASEMLDYRGCGMSVMEMSHRSAAFKGIIEEAEADLRELLGVPESYRVLFLQGGATLQFAAIPMNLMRPRPDGSSGTADYIVSGSWSKKAFKEAKLYGEARCAASSEDGGFSYVPDADSLDLSPDADYVYICQNETIYGTRYPKLPDTGNVPLVSDASSMFLSEPMDVSRYGLIYGGAQKNIGPAGVTIVVVRDDLVRDDVLPFTPTIMRYKTHPPSCATRRKPTRAASPTRLPPGASTCAGLCSSGSRSAGGLRPRASATRRRRACSTTTWTSRSCSRARPARRTARL